MAEASDAQTAKRISNAWAILVGTAWVNLPVLVILGFGYLGGGVIAVLLWRSNSDFVSIALNTLTATTFGLGPFVAAWSWWSFNIPKWRVWSLKRVTDWPSLERAAIGAGLIWNEQTFPGSLFSRTEIWSRKDRQLEADLKHHHRLSQKGS